MAVKKKSAARDKARRLLSGGAIYRDDSDDELGTTDHPWEFIYDKHDVKRITGARMGRFSCNIGDALLLKAPAGNEAWVALLCTLSEGEIEDEDGNVEIQKKAGMLWFSSHREIRGRNKRQDYLANELYITSSFDENPLTTINGKARVVSEKRFRTLYPSGKPTRKTQAGTFSKTFVCRRGANVKTATYTDEFVWEDFYRGSQDTPKLLELIDSQTIKTRKRKVTKEEGEDPSTPQKRRKLASGAPTPAKAKELTPRKILTPSNKRILAKRPLEFTPLGTRILSDQHASPHQLARSTLHVSTVPHALPCREDEFDTIYSHLEASITAGAGACIYISGTPGTGKTATVREVVASLQASAAEEQLDDFYFVEINGMKVTDPNQSYSLLWEALKGDRVSPSHALELLEQEFTTPSPRRVPCVVLMDELDQLVTRNQGVMYNFFNWPQLRHSRLIVLAVANTMDLPERTLSNKISSRLGLTRITFAGYTHVQLMSIIQSRLEGASGVIVEPDAVQFASRKVAAVSGDARRALDICRRAVEIAEQDMGDADGKENEPPDTPSKTLGKVDTKRAGVVTIATIKRAINESTSTPLASALRGLPLASKLFLAAILARVRRTGLVEAVLGDVVDEAQRMATTSQSRHINECLLTPDLRFTEQSAGATAERNVKPHQDGKQVARVIGIERAALELADLGIIGFEHRHGDRVGRLRLATTEEDIRMALRDDDECRGLGFDA